MLFSQSSWTVGQILSSQFQCRPLLYPRNGATQGSSTSTLTGTVPSYRKTYPYTVKLTRAFDGQVNEQTAQFYYAPAPAAASIADFLIKFARHLQIYHDLTCTVTATTVVSTSRNFGYTPAVTFLVSGSALAVTATSAASAPKPILPGTVVGHKAAISPGYTERTVGLPGAGITSGNSRLGVVVAGQKEAAYKTALDVELDVMFQGDVAMRLAGTGPLVEATAELQLGWDTSTTPGQFAVAGTTAANFDLVFIGAKTGYQSQAYIFQPNTNLVLPGEVFSMHLNG